MAGGNSRLVPEPLDELRFAEVVRSLVTEAEDYTDDKLRPRANDAWRRFYGRRPSDGDVGGVDAEPADGGSDLVMSEVKDAVLGAMPDIMEMFAGSDLVVEYFDDGTAKLPPLAAMQGVMPAEPSAVTPEVASRYANAIFWENGGWRALHDATMEAVCADIGWFKVHKQVRRHFDRHSGQISHMAMQAVVADPSHVVETAEPAAFDAFGNALAYHASVRRYYTTSKLLIEAVDAASMIVTQACDEDEAALIGEKRTLRFGELVAMGIDPAELEEVAGEEYGEDRQAREFARGESVERLDPHGHWSLTPTTLYEVYPLIDQDGDGLPERWRVLLAGTGKKVLRAEPVECHPYVAVVATLVPHRLHGIGYGDTLADLQEARSINWRAIQDNAQDINNPVWLAPRNGVDHNQLAAWRRDKIVHALNPDMVREVRPAPIINQLIPVHELLEQIKESRTGQSRAAQGLDPDALQNTTATAIAGTMGAAQRKQELTVRTLAEVGLKGAFRKLLYLMREMPPRQVPMPGGGSQTADPAYFDPTWGVRAVVGLGNMRRQELRGVYQSIFAIQSQVIAKLGPANPLCSLEHVARTLRGWMSLYPGLRPDDNFANPEAVAQAIAAQAQQPPQPDPKTELERGKLELEGQKVGLKGQELQLKAQEVQRGHEHGAATIQVAAAKAQADAQIRAQRDAADTELKRRKDEADMALEAAKQLHAQQMAEAELMAEVALKRMQVEQPGRQPGETNVRRPS